MKVSIIVGGRFHAFDMAEQLSKNDFLHQLVTSYPRFYIKNNFSIHNKSIISLPLKEIIHRFASKFSIVDKYLDIDLITSNIFSSRVSKYVDFKNTDILVGWSSFSLNSFKISKNYDCLNVLERGSSHIEFQKELLEEEYSLLGLKPKLPSSSIIDKEKEEYNLSDFICVPSEFAKKSFIKKGFSASKIIKIPYGVDLNNFKKINKDKINDRFTIICVGSLSVRKGTLYLIKAFNDLKIRNSQLILVGSIERDFKELIKPLLNENIKLIKPVNQNFLKHYYNNASVFVTCSIEEGLSMVQIQAMACGLPVICTTNSGGEDIISDNESGYILPIRNIEKLKEKLLFLYENKKHLLFMSNNAREKAHSYFSWENYGKNIINFYSSIFQNQIKKK